jgi:hypothetical protein
MSFIRPDKEVVCAIFKYCRLQKPVRFSIFGPAPFFWPHFDLVNHQKVIFCYCSSSRWNDFYIDDLDDEFSSYMCSSLLKTLYSARFFNDLIQIVWFSSSSRSFDSLFWSSSRLAFLGDRFWNLSYRWKIFLHVSRCLRNWHSSDDRMTDFDQVLRSSSSDFHQVHDL